MNVPDYLEEMTTTTKICAIVFLQNGKRVAVKERLMAISGEKGQEVLELYSGLRIMLNDILIIDGVPVGNTY